MYVCIDMCTLQYVCLLSDLNDTDIQQHTHATQTHTHNYACLNHHVGGHCMYANIINMHTLRSRNYDGELLVCKLMV